MALNIINRRLKNASPYNAIMTGEQFLFHETRITAKLTLDGLEKKEILQKISAENLFQYPTEKSVKRIARACVKRLEALENKTLTAAIVNEPGTVAKQICLYAMMRQYRLMRDFMLTVIGEKYKKLDSSFSKYDVEDFFLQLQEQDDWAMTWSESTNEKLQQVIKKILVETEYLDSTRATRLNAVLISPILEKAIREAGEEKLLPAFNCLT